jgi:hypothetical protein
MGQLSNVAAVSTSKSDSKRSSGKRVVLEALECRQLLSVSAAAAPSGPASGSIVLHERAGVQFTADLGNFVFLAPGTNLQASVSWGDGSVSKGVIKADGIVGVDQIDFEVDGTHTYANAGTYAINAAVFLPGPTPTTEVRLVASFNDKAVVSRGNVLLNGSISGTYLLAPTSVDTGAEYIFTGAGTAGDLGAVYAQGNVILPGLVTTGHATGTLTLSSIGTTPANSGSVTLKLTGPAEPGFGQFPSTLNYVITGGTGAFAGATGAGSIAVTLSGNQFEFDITSDLIPASAA